MVDSMNDVTTNSVAEVLRILFKRKRTILAFLLATIATVGGASIVLYDSIYSTTAQILVQRGREHILDVTLQTTGAVRPVVSFDREEQIAIAKEILHGRSLIEQTVREIGHENIFPSTEATESNGESRFDYAVLELQNGIRIERISNAALLNVTFEHKDPVVAANVVNTLVRLYLDRHIEIQRGVEMTGFYADQFKILRERQETNEKALIEFKETYGISSNLEQKRGFLLDQQMALQAQANDIAIELAGAERRLSQVRRQIGAQDSGKILSARLYEDLVAQQLDLDAGVRSLRARRDAQAAQLAEYEASIAALEGLDPTFDRLHEQSKVDQQAYRLYLAKFEESKISDAMDKEGIASIKVVESAHVPSRPQPNQLILALALALVMGSFGGIVLALLLEYAGGTIDSEEDVERLLQLPLLAVVPDATGS